MIVYTIEINGELKFVESDPDTVRRVVSDEVEIDLRNEFSKEENEKFVVYTVKVDSWCV